MKTSIFFIIIFISFKGVAQLHSGTPVVQSKTQPVPNSSTTEKSAPPQPLIIPPLANPVPPIYPGANVKAVEIPRQLINPPVTPSGTQPKQKEPLSPIESTNVLQPNRPQRDEASRTNQPVAIPADNLIPTKPNKDINYEGSTARPVFVKPSLIKTNGKTVSVKNIRSKKVTSHKKLR